MLILSIRYPGNRPREYSLRPGTMITIGRQMDNDVALADTSVSRTHAQIEYNTDDQVFIQDLGSANGTFVNLYRIPQQYPHILDPDDIVRIGLHEITLYYQDQEPQQVSELAPPSQPVTPELSQDSLDRRAALMYRVANLLNTAPETSSALQRVSQLLKRSMNADKCELVFADQFSRLRERGFPETIARMAVERRSAVIVPDSSQPEQDLSESAGRLLIHSAMCVPVMSDQNITALIYMYRTDASARQFDRSDVQLAEAVSHMVALTLERMSLAERIREEEKLRRLLHCYLAPARVQDILQNYLRTGRLPGLTEEHATVLFADIVDSTGLSERLGARRFGEVLKRYYQDMTQIVFDHGGFLDKYLDDGIMAIFGMGADALRPEQNAIYAGLAMLNSVESYYRSELDRIQLGVGVNSGPVVAGYVRTQDRVEFTVLGDTVNVAFGLQSLARPDRLFIGPHTYDAIRDSFTINEIGFTPLRGREVAVRIHEVMRS